MTSRSLTNRPTTAPNTPPQARGIRRLFGAAAAGLLGLATQAAPLSAQVNTLRPTTEPAPFAAPASAQPIRAARQAEAQSRTARDQLVRSAVYTRAVDARGGNAIRLTEYHEPAPVGDGPTTLRWVDPAEPQPQLSDDPTTLWRSRDDIRQADARNHRDAVTRPSDDPLADPFAERTPRREASQPSTRSSAATKPSSPRLSGEEIWSAAEAFQRPTPAKPYANQVRTAQPQASTESLESIEPLAETDAAPQLPPTPSRSNASPTSPSNASPTYDDFPDLDRAAPDDEPSELPGIDPAPAPEPDLLQDPPSGLPEEDQDYYDNAELGPLGRDCSEEQARCNRVQLTSIRDISLDVTPEFAPGLQSEAERQAALEEQLARIPSRTWTGDDGQQLAEGRMVDLSQGSVHVETADGTIRKLPMFQLGDEERCFVAAWWKLPLDCQLTDAQAVPRHHIPMTFTWTASGLCNKPLYFEERNLERYGHAAHPLIQPALSGAHFFSSIVTLPYQAGINPPYECRYDLGHYRVGSCAPWLVPPIPVSLRGALMQASVLGAGIPLIP